MYNLGMETYTLLWSIFIFISTILFLLDFKLSILKPHEISFKESILLCSLWIMVASVYGLIIGKYLGYIKMSEYFTAYIVEYSLSIDNMFVFLMVFQYFNIERKYQPKVLVIGILSAIVMRLIFIFTGIALINRFNWLLYVFGVVLLYTGYKMFFHGDEKIEPEKNIALRFISKKIKIDMSYKGPNFFTTINGKIVPTIMIAVLIVIETTDIIFAVDSIPAVLAISQDKLIVYSSNIFAVIGLRSLYFALASIKDYFIYLKHGVAIVLFYIGIKMILSKFFHINPFVSLLIVTIILIISIVLSVINKK